MRAVVCGAGIAGLALALGLDSAGADVLLLEKSPGLRAQGYMIDFFGPGFDAAEAMGLLPRIRRLGRDIEELTYRDEDGRRRAGMRYGQFAKVLNGRLLGLMRTDLEEALFDSLPARVDVRFGTTVESVGNGPDGVTVTLTGGETVSADLLVGCDGIHSRVRRLTFGDEREYLRYLGFHTAAFVFEDPDVRAAVGAEFCMTDTVQRAMGFYGLSDSRVAIFAIHRSPDPTLPLDARSALRHEYASLGWLAPRALAACPASEEVYYDQVALIEMPCWSRQRVVLVGDSCAAVSLLGGQGASLAVAGAFILSRQLANGTSVESALHRYEQQLRPAVTRTQRSARRAVRWFIPANSVALQARRAALRLGQLPVLDRYVARAFLGRPSPV
jgi:2-polyprenyl-6-methoxyphenol hydroxylase-like FAD-dependent oxidoreductase